MEKEAKFTRLQKTILTLYGLISKTRKNIRFEDVVVALFEQYPEEFHLRGYPQYPEAEAVNKILYHAKKAGLVRVSNKFFGLTGMGLDVAKNLKRICAGKTLLKTNTLSRSTEKEVERIRRLSGLKLFLENHKDKILDTDFYNYLGASVRTKRNDFIGRISLIKEAINELKKIESGQNTNIYKKIIEYHNFLFLMFKQDIEYKSR